MPPLIRLTVVSNTTPLIGPGIHRAYARAATALAFRAVAQMKGRVHRITGTLSRSIHASRHEEGHEGDLEKGRAGTTITENISPVWAKGSTWDILAGSWIPYAIYEQERGGPHDFFQG